MTQAGLGWLTGASLSMCVACGGGSTSESSSGAAAGQSAGGAAGSMTDGGSAGSSSKAGSAGTSSSTAGSAGTSSTAGAAGAGGKSGDDGSDGTWTTYNGSLQVGWYDDGQSFSTIATATFAEPGQATGTRCTRQTIGLCDVSDCVVATPPTTMPHAGVISISSGTKLDAMLLPDANGIYSSFSARSLLLPGEDQIAITASGGDVPAFTAQMVQPLTLIVTAPAADSSGIITWQRDTDLALTFERGVAGVQLLIQGGTAAGASISCRFPSEAGKALIPATALQLLAANTLLMVFTYRPDQITAAPYVVALKNFSAATDPDKKRGIRVSLQ